MSLVPEYFPRSEIDLDSIYSYLNLKASESVADRFYLAVSETVDRLLTAPDAGTPYETKRPELVGVRICSVSGFPNHLIFYRVADPVLQVLRVIHGARNYDEFFEEDFF